MAGRRERGEDARFWLLAVACAPLVLFLGVVGALRIDAISVDTAIDDLVFGIGRFVAFAAVAAAAISVALAVRARGRGWLRTLPSVVVAASSATLLLVRQPTYDTPGANDVTTNPADPVAYSGRGGVGGGASGAAVACPGLAAIPRQVDVAEAGAALRDAGFTTTASARFRTEGTQQGFWFGLTHDAVVRIRPGETDVRVTARQDRHQGDAACRMMARIVSRLNR